MNPEIPCYKYFFHILLNNLVDIHVVKGGKPAGKDYPFALSKLLYLS